MSTQQKQHKYHIVTFGCQMNKNDSERIESIFSNMGLKSTEEAGEADVILMNSCSVRKSAEDRIFGMARNFAKLKQKNPKLIIAITGCMAGRDRNEKIKSKLKHADLFFPTKDMVHLPKWLSELNPDLKTINDLEEDYLKLRPSYSKNTQAFITIQTGCNHFCTYCVVPFARGLEINRPLKEIFKETSELAKKGCLEITLLGQIVNHYVAPDPEHFSKNNPYKKSDFAKLLWELNQIDGPERIHWTAPHPLYMTDEVIDALTLPKQINFIHLPVQSGNSEMLKKMNRRHDREFYINIIKKIRNKKPDIAIGTDIIVGFSGETKGQFDDTVSMYKECDFDISYNAQYSERSHTVAAKVFKDNVPIEEKKRRWWVLQNLMESIVLKKNQKYLNKTASILVESFKNGYCIGNSREMKLVTFKGSENLVGKIVDVKVYKVGEWMMWGEIIHSNFE